MLRLALAVVALHVTVDGFVAPEAGTGAGDHRVSAGVPLAILAGAAWLAGRARPGVRAALALVLGVLALVGAGLAVAHARAVEPAGDDWTGFALLPAGLVLVGLGARLLWRSRNPHGRRHLRRAGLAVGALAGVYWVVMPIAVSIGATHRPREAVEAVDLGRPYTTVAVPTSDGLTLDGRYVVSRNGAAVIVFPGSASRAPQARLLARRGYGVLMLDMRGYAASDGDPNAFGWGATKDLDAGVAFLRARTDVEAGRIGGIGFSVGGEVLIEAAADNPGLRAVASEGAGQRSVREALIYGLRGALALPAATVQTIAVAALSGDPPPPSLRDVIGRIAPRSLLLIHAEHGTGGEELQTEYFAAAGQPKALWKVAGARHTGGFAAQPREYERRLLAFFDEALLGRASTDP